MVNAYVTMATFKFNGELQEYDKIAEIYEVVPNNILLLNS